MMRRFDLTIVAIIALFGAWVIWAAASRYGIGLSPDSIQYVSVAKNICSGRVLVGANGEPFVLWPPLYPTLLAALVCPGIEVTLAAQIFSSILFAATLILAGLIMLRLEIRGAFLAIGLLLILSSSSLLRIFTMAWSEGLFTVLFLCLPLLWPSSENGASKWRAWRYVAVIALSLTRLVGAAIALPIVFFESKSQPRYRMAGKLFLLWAPLLIWFCWVRAQSGSFGGGRSGGGAALVDLSYAMGKAFGSEVLPGASALWGGAIFFLMSVVFRRAQREPLCVVEKFMLAQCVAYVLFYLAAAMTTEIDQIGERFLAPLAPMIWVFILRGAATQLQNRKTALERLRSSIAGALLAALLLIHVAQASALVRNWRDEGTGYYSWSVYQSSKIPAWVKEHASPAQLYSNVGDWLGFATSLTVRQLPGIEQLKAERADMHEQFYVAYFYRTSRSYPATPQGLQENFELIGIVPFEDGIVIQAGAPKR